MESDRHVATPLLDDPTPPESRCSPSRCRSSDAAASKQARVIHDEAGGLLERTPGMKAGAVAARGLLVAACAALLPGGCLTPGPCPVLFEISRAELGALPARGAAAARPLSPLRG
jgi:hypothetical protein